MKSDQGGDGDDKMYYDILNKKIDHPIKRKRKKQEAEQQEEFYEAEQDYEQFKGIIFKVEKDPQAVQNQISY